MTVDPHQQFCFFLSYVDNASRSPSFLPLPHFIHRERRGRPATAQSNSRKKKSA